MHPRNRHQERYDLPRLAKAHAPLAAFVVKNAHGDLSVDFADPRAVVALNQALLKDWYGIEHWDVPPGYLSPPVPGRADYIHHVAELVGEGAKRVLDVGTGASCIYPIIGRCEYGWSFVGTDVDEKALGCARTIVEANPRLKGGVELRLQKAPAVLKGVILPGERFDLVVCNPPFHASQAEADAATKRKWTNLGHRPDAGRNFGGQGRELWAPGGEERFVRTMIDESRDFAGQVEWFTALISKAETLSKLPKVKSQVREMGQGNKKSRILAWSF